MLRFCETCLDFNGHNSCILPCDVLIIYIVHVYIISLLQLQLLQLLQLLQCNVCINVYIDVGIAIAILS